MTYKLINILAPVPQMRNKVVSLVFDLSLNSLKLLLLLLL